MTTRDELIDAGAKAICEQYEPVANSDERLRRDVGIVLDAVEPLIRADERRHMSALVDRYSNRLDAADQTLIDLRAKVEALLEQTPRRRMAALTYSTGRVDGRRKALDDVLALLDGTADDH
jgi:hypothetical protein